jgi:hypothetical protein
MEDSVRDDIIRMAREARLAEHTHPYQLWSASDDGLERLAALVAAAEREACAKVCMEDASLMRGGTPPQIALMEAAAGIRARGNK